MFLFTFISVPNNLTFDNNTQMNNQQYKFHNQLERFPSSKWNFRGRRALYQYCGYFPGNGPEEFGVNRTLAKQRRRQDFHGVNFSHHFSAGLRSLSSRLKDHGHQTSEMMFYNEKLSPFFWPRRSKEAFDLTPCCFHASHSARHLHCTSHRAPPNTETRVLMLDPASQGRKEGGKFGSLLFQPREEAKTGESVFAARGSLSFLHCRIALRELSPSKALPPLASGRKISKGITHNFLCCSKLSHNFFFSKNKLWEKLPVLLVVWGRGEITGNQYMTCSSKTDTAHTHTD